MTDAEIADCLEEALGATRADLKPLTDEELERSGLKAVRAFVRTRQSRAALRTVRHRQRQAAAGLRQMNIVAPDTDEARAALKAMADALALGRLTPGDVARLVDAQRHEFPSLQMSGAGQVSEGPSPAGASAGIPGGPSRPACVEQKHPFAEELARVHCVLEVGGWRAMLIRWLARGAAPLVSQHTQ